MSDLTYAQIGSYLRTEWTVTRRVCALEKKSITGQLIVTLPILRFVIKPAERDESLDEIPKRLAQALAREHISLDKFFLMQHGETRLHQRKCANALPLRRIEPRFEKELARCATF